jgi:hypothetical protein
MAQTIKHSIQTALRDRRRAMFAAHPLPSWTIERSFDFI